MTDVVAWSTDRSGSWIVTLQRPPANALAPDLLDGLHEAMDAAEADGGVSAMVITSGIEGFFAAGADIKHLADIDAPSFVAYGDLMRAVNDRLEASSWISIAAVDGLALGGGLELAMACTMRVATTRSRLGLPEVKLGLIPGAGGTQRLPRLVGRGHALDIMLTARQVGGEEALSIGLVDRLVEDDPVAAALALAADLGSGSTAAQLAVVRSVDVASELTLAEGIAFERDQIGQLFSDGDAAEGIAAFVDKRRPDFR